MPPFNLGIDGEAGKAEGEDRQRADPVSHPPPAGAVLAPNNLVEAETQQPRDQFEPRSILAVALRPGIGGDRLLMLVGELAVGTDLEAQRRRKAFAFRIA